MSSSTSLPSELVAELSGHQGPVRAVRFNSKLAENRIDFWLWVTVYN